MNFSLYWQNSSKPRKSDGQVFYAGEDAHPWASDRLLLVADGMGGDAAIYHVAFNTALFDREQIVRFLFGENAEAIENGRFAAYVRDSFSELYPLRKLYDAEDLAAIKKSGYFGSRFTAFSFIREQLMNPALFDSEVFSRLDAASTEEQQLAVLQNMENALSTSLDRDLRSLANTANLVYEGPIPKRKLLGTTLCAIMFKETPENIHALVIMAGDSYPFFWSPKCGMIPLFSTQRAAGGRGTIDCIHITDTTPIKLHCKYYKLKSPGFLFCITDGCWDGARFKIATRLALETYLLDAFSNSDSPEAAMAVMKTFYAAKNSDHDDSGSIAGVILGFDDYASFRVAAAERRGFLQREFYDKLPLLTEYDYNRELKKQYEPYEKALETIKPLLLQEPAFLKYCVQKVKEESYLQVVNTLELDKVDTEISLATQELHNAQQALFSEEIRESDDEEVFTEANECKSREAAKAAFMNSERTANNQPQNAKIDMLRKTVWNAEKKVARLKEEKVNLRIAAAVKEYGDKHFHEILDALLAMPENMLPEDLTAEIRSLRTAVIKLKESELGQNATLQLELIDHYSKAYQSKLEEN